MGLRQEGAGDDRGLSSCWGTRKGVVSRAASEKMIVDLMPWYVAK